MVWLALVIVVAAAAWDLAHREVPDVVPAALLLCAVVGAVLSPDHPSMTSRILGLVLALAGGAALFAAGGFGGGDVKLLAALGAVLGLRDLLASLFWVALAGGALALVAWWRGARELPYAPAIALGLLAFLLKNRVWP